MKARLLIALTMTAATLSGPVGATIVEGKKGDAGARPGGLEVPVGEGETRLECWQNGRRIIESIDRNRLALGYSSRSGSVVVRLPDGKSATVSMEPLGETYCVVLPRG